MKAIVERPFKGARDGEVRPVQLRAGDEIEGDLARVAITAGYARALNAAPANKAIEAAPENRFRTAQVGGSDGGDTGERAKPERPAAKRGRGRPKKA